MASVQHGSASRLIEQAAIAIAVGDGQQPCVVSVSGELDVLSAAALERELDRLLSTAPLVVLDLGGLAFIDSTGVRCLLRVARQAEATGDRLRMLAPSEEVDHALEATGIRPALPIIECR